MEARETVKTTMIPFRIKITLIPVAKVRDYLI